MLRAVSILARPKVIRTNVYYNEANKIQNKPHILHSGQANTYVKMDPRDCRI